MSDSEDLETGEIGWEGWETETTDDEHVRRFAKPPYRWIRVRRDRFPRRVRRRRGDPTLEEAGGT